MLPMKEVKKMPSWHHTPFPSTDIFNIFASEKLHTHDSKNENDDAENKGQIRKSSHSIRHDSKNII